MNKFHPSRLADRRRLASAAFTLLELLVVISIIAVLAGILLPVTGAVMENARKVSAKNTEMQIVTAVKSFQTDYGFYPNPGNVAVDKTWTSSTNQDLFAVLRANEGGATVVNTRHVVYFDGKDAKNPSAPKDGFATKAATNTVGTQSFTLAIGALVDPWGAGYMIRYDTGYSDALKHPYSNDTDGANDAAGDTDIIRSTVVVWSYGKDGLKGNNGTVTGVAPAITSYGDDVISWQ